MERKKKGNGEGKRYANMMTSSMREEKAEREEKQERSHIKHRGRKCTIRIPVQKRGITGLKIKNKHNTAGLPMPSTTLIATSCQQEDIIINQNLLGNRLQIFYCCFAKK